MTQIDQYLGGYSKDLNGKGRELNLPGYIALRGGVIDGNGKRRYKWLWFEDEEDWLEYLEAQERAHKEKTKG